MRRQAPVSLICFLALLAVGAAHATAAEREVWFVVEFSGTAVGIGRDRWVRSQDGVFYESYVEIRARRLGVPIEMISRIEEWDDDAHRVIRFETETSINGEWIRSTGATKGDAVYVTTTGAGYSQADTITWQSGAVGSARVDDEIRERFRAGDREFAIKIFDPRSAGFHRSRFVAAGEAEEGKSLHIYQFDDDAEVPTTELWLDDNQDIERVEATQLNLTLAMRRVQLREIAGLTLDPNFDMIREQMIPCAGYPASPARLDQVQFELNFARPPGDISGFTGPNQRVLSRTDRTMVVVVMREPAPDAVAEGAPELFLGPARYIQSDAPAIRVVADSIAAATGASGVALARSITLWVGRHISEKGYTRGFSSAVEVLRNRSGDCSEHSVLLAAVLRAAGIPSRIVVGLAYDGGGLIGHMWTEAFVGRWVTLDALDPDNDPKRIRITASPDHRALDEAAVVNAYSLVGGLRVEVTRHEAADR